MEKQKTKVKYDKWFLIVLVILLYTLMKLMIDLIGVIPYNLTNIGLWLRLAACLIAIYGNVWVFRMYISNTRRQARRNERTEKAIKEHPELKDIINDIAGRKE